MVHRALRENQIFRQQLSGPADGFDAMDVNGDGVIDRHEFNSYMSNHLPHQPPPTPAYNTFFAKAFADRGLPNEPLMPDDPQARSPLRASTSTTAGNAPYAGLHSGYGHSPPAAHQPFSTPHQLPQQPLLWTAPPSVSSFPHPTEIPANLSVIEQALEANEKLRQKLKAAREGHEDFGTATAPPERVSSTRLDSVEAWRGQGKYMSRQDRSREQLTDETAHDSLRVSLIKEKLSSRVSEKTQQQLREALGDKSSPPRGPLEMELMIRDKDEQIARMQREIELSDQKINEVINASESIVKSALAEQQTEIETLKLQLQHSNKVVESERAHLNFALEKLGMRRLELMESMSSSQRCRSSDQSPYGAALSNLIGSSSSARSQDWNIPDRL
eukprot:TRINITY_DN6608_c0_g1_i2.p1 TRINITY_DN6608_c0_g1~~TRINITY_DN6608_c0_g1_i2.p1  ORF type:complete len:387 (+),score=87.76 TRINITY_DN6608_c0_g1_i2:140-1300(+)